MIRPFADLPIRRKLALLLVGSNTLALLALFTAMAGYQLTMFRSELGDRFQVTAQMLARNSSAMLVFGDRRGAQDLLASLGAEENVVCAHTVTLHDGIQATYRQCGDFHPAPVGTSTGQAVPPLFAANHDVQVPVLLDGGVVGAVHVRYSLRALHAQLRNFLVLLGLTLGATIAATLWLSTKLQRGISRPIADLVAMMRRVSEERNYALRARHVGHDEVGALVEGFNGMLGLIEERDVRVQRYAENLEGEVARRTMELSHARDVAQAAAEAAQAAARAKSEFLATMSHEIRTPLNGVIGLSDLLRATAMSEQQKEFVQGIAQSGQLLMAVINDVLDFSKIEAGQLQLEMRPFGLHQCVEAAVQLVRPQASAKGLAIRFEIDPQTPVCIVGDETRLSQVLVNLLNNAVKFTPSGEVHLRADAAWPATGTDPVQVRVSIRDSGIGMTPEQQARLFQPFCQGDTSTTRRFGGSGLGLAICKRLIDAMQGTILVSSEPGKGSTFEIAFPAAQAIDAPVRADSAAQCHEAPDEAPSLSILVVEDNEMNQLVVKRMLGRIGLEPQIADDGRSAVEMAKTRHFDLVLMDMQMPDLDGLQATRRIRAELPTDRTQPYIVALTANALQTDRQRCLDAGMDDYLSKPVRFAELVALAHRAASRRPQPVAAAESMSDAWGEDRCG